MSIKPTSDPKQPTDADIRALTVFSVHKAGMKEESLARINQIVYEHSKDSPHFLNQQRKDEKTIQKISSMLRTLQDLESSWKYLPPLTLNIAHNAMNKLIQSHTSNYLPGAGIKQRFLELCAHLHPPNELQQQQQQQQQQPQQPQQLPQEFKTLTPLSSHSSTTQTSTSLAMYNCFAHMDLDSFFASATLLEYPHLVTKPVAIGSLQMIATSNYVARTYGIRSAQPGFIAKRLCPSLIFLPGNYQWYSFLVDSFIRPLLSEFDPHFSSISLDEAGLDLTTSYLFNIYRPCLHLNEASFFASGPCENENSFNFLSSSLYSLQPIKSHPSLTSNSTDEQISKFNENEHEHDDETSTCHQHHHQREHQLQPTESEAIVSFLQSCLVPSTELFHYPTYTQRLDHIYKYYLGQQSNSNPHPTSKINQLSTTANPFLHLNPHHIQLNLLSPCSFCLLNDFIKEYCFLILGVTTHTDMVAFLRAKLIQMHKNSFTSPFLILQKSQKLDSSPSSDSNNSNNSNQIDNVFSNSLFLLILEEKRKQLAYEIQIYKRTVSLLSMTPQSNSITNSHINSNPSITQPLTSQTPQTPQTLPIPQTFSLEQYLTQITTINDSFRGIYPHSIPQVNLILFESKTIELETISQLHTTLSSLIAASQWSFTSKQIDFTIFFHLVGDLTKECEHSPILRSPSRTNIEHASTVGLSTADELLSLSITSPLKPISMQMIYSQDNSQILFPLFSTMSSLHNLHKASAIQVGNSMVHNYYDDFSHSVISPKPIQLLDPQTTSAPLSSTPPIQSSSTIPSIQSSFHNPNQTSASSSPSSPPSLQQPFSIQSLKQLEYPTHYHRSIFRYGRPTTPFTFTFPIVFDILNEIRFQIYRVTHLTSSYGAGPSHMVAKITSDIHKPYGHCIIPNTASDLHNFMDKLNIRKIPGVGRVLEKILNALQIHTCGDLLNSSHAMLRLKHVLGKVGFNWIVKAVNGGNPFSLHFFDTGSLSLDNTTALSTAKHPVGIFGNVIQPTSSTKLSLPGNIPLDRKSMSYERTFPGTNNFQFVNHVIDRLCAKLYLHAKREGIIGRCITIKVKYTSFVVKQRSTTVEKCLHDDITTESIWKSFSEPIAKRRFNENNFLSVSYTHDHTNADIDIDDEDDNIDNNGDDIKNANLNNHIRAVPGLDPSTSITTTAPLTFPSTTMKSYELSWLTSLQKTAKNLFELEYNRALKDDQRGEDGIFIRLIGVRLSTLELIPSLSPQNKSKSKGIAAVFGWDQNPPDRVLSNNSNSIQLSTKKLSSSIAEPTHQSNENKQTFFDDDFELTASPNLPSKQRLPKNSIINLFSKKDNAVKHDNNISTLFDEVASVLKNENPHLIGRKNTTFSPKSSLFNQFDLSSSKIIEKSLFDTVDDDLVAFSKSKKKSTSLSSIFNVSGLSQTRMNPSSSDVTFVKPKATKTNRALSNLFSKVTPNNQEHNHHDVDDDVTIIGSSAFHTNSKTNTDDFSVINSYDHNDGVSQISLGNKPFPSQSHQPSNKIVTISTTSQAQSTLAGLFGTTSTQNTSLELNSKGNKRKLIQTKQSALLSETPISSPSVPMPIDIFNDEHMNIFETVISDGTIEEFENDPQHVNKKQQTLHSCQHSLEYSLNLTADGSVIEKNDVGDEVQPKEPISTMTNISSNEHLFQPTLFPVSHETNNIDIEWISLDSSSDSCSDANNGDIISATQITPFSTFSHFSSHHLKSQNFQDLPDAFCEDNDNEEDNDQYIQFPLPSHRSNNISIQTSPQPQPFTSHYNQLNDKQFTGDNSLNKIDRDNTTFSSTFLKARHSQQKPPSISRQLSISNIGLFSMFEENDDDESDGKDDETDISNLNHFADQDAPLHIHPFFSSSLFTSVVNGNTQTNTSSASINKHQSTNLPSITSALLTNTSQLIEIMYNIDKNDVDAIWDQ